MAATAGPEATPRLTAARPSHVGFVAVCAFCFVASTAATIAWCGPMEESSGMPMPGRWNMSMAWMRMPDQTWPAAAAAFVGMWAVMMVAMMLPSLVAMLWRYREALGAVGGRRVGVLTSVVALAYFLVWTALGAVIYPVGVAAATVEMAVPAVARAVPLAAGAVVALAGLGQLTRWKARHLACCRESPGSGRPLAADARSAWWHGLRLGLRCCACCAGPTAALLAVGVMDVRAMIAATGVITLERLAPEGLRLARAIGVVAAVLGAASIVRTLASG